MTKTLVIVAGGTGGHLYPGVALAREMKKRGWAVSFVVRRGDLGREVLSGEGFSVHELSGQGLPRRLSWRAPLFPVRLAAGSAGAIRLLRRLRPQCVVGMGGYLSFPVLASARLLGMPTMIHEQNVVPGLSNRLLARVVHRVALSFEESRPYFANPNTRVTGLPIRSEIGSMPKAAARDVLKLHPTLPTYLVFGGSQGASRLNRVILEWWPQLLKREKRFQVLHITGNNDYETVQSAYQSLELSAVVMPYCHQMEAAYAAADTVICRSGASSVAELIAAHRPALLIPFPFASANHQYYNALVMERRQLAKIIVEADLSPTRLGEALDELDGQAQRRDERFVALEESAHVRVAAQSLAAQIETVYN